MRWRVGAKMKMANEDIIEQQFRSDTLCEYEWPEKSGDRWVIQEQFCNFIDISGFKRKYPKIQRRNLDIEEVKFLYDKRILTEQQYSMGVSVISYDDAIELLRRDFPSKHDMFVREKMKKQRESMVMNVSAEEMPAQLRKAAKSVSEFTAKLNLLRKEKFQSYYDSNTNCLHLPVKRFKKLNAEQTKPTPYPVTVLAGQFATDFKKYTMEELKMMPLNTSLLPPPVEADFNALFAFDDKELVIDPNEEIVSDEEPTPKKRRGPKPKSKVDDETGDAAETASNSSAVSADTCCTCRERFAPDDISQSCSVCMRSSHIGCLGISEEQHKVIATYKWACIECKKCCVCAKAGKENLMIFCDRCDRGYHTFCVGLRAIPKGLWVCRICFKEDPTFSERHGGKKMRAQRKHKTLTEFMKE